jgi:1-acyl-sn-glycerol-3-phosphate acyltransferase
MVSYLTGASFVSRIENMRMPIFGKILRSRQFIAVDREGGAAGVKAEIQRRVDDARYPPVGIFPEGTTLNGTALISLGQVRSLQGLQCSRLW